MTPEEIDAHTNVLRCLALLLTQGDRVEVTTRCHGRKGERVTWSFDADTSLMRQARRKVRDRLEGRAQAAG